jgi:hypothetical protein
VAKGMKTRIRKILFRYNGDPATDESILDREGLMAVPCVGDLLNRNGRKWRVENINDDFVMAGQKRIPVYHVFLTDQI